MKIDRNLLPMKAHYFLFNAGQAPVVPFIPTLAKELGFSSVTVGTIYTFLPIMGMLAKPLMGGIADRFHCQKMLFISFILGVIVFFFGIPWIPSLPSAAVSDIHCDKDSIVKLCSDNLANNTCYAERIVEQGDVFPNITCHMTCNANASFIDSACHEWNQTQFCAAPHREPVNHILNIVKKNNGMSLKNENPTPSKLIASSGPQIMNFEAYLTPTRTEQIGKCLFIHLDRVQFNSGPLVVPFCDSLKETTCDTHCENAALNEVFLNPKISDSDVVTLYQFWIFVICLVTAWVSMAVVVSVGDAICFELLGDFPSKYGNQRLWGSIGWGLLSIIAGLIVDRASQGQATKNYLPAFFLMAVLLLLDFIVCIRLKYKQVKTSASILRDVGKLLSELKIVIFMIWCICVGMCTALVWNFLFWYLEDLAKQDCDSMNWIKTLQGLAMGIQCFGGELPFFFLSGWILKKVGHIHSMSLVLLSIGIRFLLYSFLTNPWWCLPIELFNGPTFGLFYATMASYASIVAPPGTESTTQGIVGAVFEGLGVSLGSFLGGLLFHNVGGAMTFRIFGIGALIMSFVHFSLQYITNRRSNVLQIHERDFKQARYASPNDAIHMLEDTLQDINLHR